jgi:hypothetical protein
MGVARHNDVLSSPGLPESKHRISLYSSATKNLPMDARLLDVIIGVIAFLILVALLTLLPMVMTAGIAYLTAIIIFILFLSGAGYLVNEKIA